MDVSGLMNMTFPQLVKLLYRDDVKQKHQNQDRLHKEIKDKDLELKGKPDPKDSKADQIPRWESTPIAEMGLKHLQAATWPG